jgi:hypothetical protein
MEREVKKKEQEIYEDKRKREMLEEEKQVKYYFKNSKYFSL